MKLCPILLCALGIVLTMLSDAARADDEAPPPSSKGDASVPAVHSATEVPKFLPLHRQFVKRAREGNIDLLFLGDSITAGWSRDLWAKHYQPLHAANFGLGGDWTQHVLWRITNGELDGIHPRVVVLQIGTNNSNFHSPQSIAAAIQKIIGIVHEKTGANVLLVSIFPRERDSVTNDHRMATIRAVNEIIARLDDGKNVRYLNLWQKFMTPDGKVNQSLYNDGLHPNRKGYEVWAGAMQPTLDEMMKG